jgi:hypothetical protein
MLPKRLLTGVLAGAAGTAAMTLHQKIRQRLSQPDGESEPSGDSDPWKSAPAPAQVGKLGLEALGLGPVSPGAIPVLTQVMHWSYGSLWGAVYAGLRLPGPLFGLAVWAASYAQLVPLGIYDPPWEYSPGAIADEIGYHLTYGTALALSFRGLQSRA